MLPETPEGALAELERVRAKGGVAPGESHDRQHHPKLDDPAWEPLWQALEESGIILSWHITVFVGKPGDRVAGKAASVFENTKLSWRTSSSPRRPLRLGHPRAPSRLRMVMAEAGTGWLPWLVQELDYRHWRLWEAKEFWADKGGSALETKPSELFKRQIYATFQEDHVAMSLIPSLAMGTCCGRRTIRTPTASGPTPEKRSSGRCGTCRRRCRRKLTHDNAPVLYGLGGA